MTKRETVDDVGAAIRAFIEAQLPSAQRISVSGLSRSVAGFSRENWTFDAAWTEDGRPVERRLILRRDPVGSVLETERGPEFLVLSALAATDVPSPRVHWLDASGRWLQRPSIVMERYEGRNDRNVLNTTHFPSLYPIEYRRMLARRYCAILAQIHTVDWQALGLEKLGVPEGPYGAAQTEIARWEAYLAAQAVEPQPVLAEALCWLRRHKPPAQRITLVHGDFRPGNSLIDEHGVAVMLDWEMAHLGDPMEDLGWYTTPHYAPEHLMPGEWEAADLYRCYEERTGLKVDEDGVAFWRVLGQFKLAAIALTGVRSFCEGRSDRASIGSLMMQEHVARLIGI